MNNLSFCPRNKLLQSILSDFVQSASGVLTEVIIHHVTAVGNNLLQFEYEAKYRNGEITFGRLICETKLE